MTEINLPGQFVMYWKGSEEYQNPGMGRMSADAEEFRQAYDAGVYRRRGDGFSVAVDITPGPVLKHLEQLAEDFAEVCSPTVAHTRAELAASKKLNKLLEMLRERS